MRPNVALKRKEVDRQKTKRKKFKHDNVRKRATKQEKNVDKEVGPAAPWRSKEGEYPSQKQGGDQGETDILAMNMFLRGT